MVHTPQNTPNELDRETLFRYQVVSLVLGREAIGDVRAQAVNCAVNATHAEPSGDHRRVSQRSIYRWLKAYAEHGLPGLMGKRRLKTATSEVLERRLLDYLVTQKREDPAASIPELIKRARRKGLIKPGQSVDRSTVWRALKRMGVSTKRGRAPKKGKCRRFAFAHRMDMVLCDGKHFRVGVNRLKRVVLFFLDDATRMILATIVGTSESAELFLRGLARCVTNYGLMRTLYLDRGPGFRADASWKVVANLGVPIILGQARYPQGHGKIERFNRRVWDALLRRFCGNPEIDSSEEHLTLRLDHYVRQIYNHEPHESLGGQTPWSRFGADPVPLRFPADQRALTGAFTLPYGRVVAKDHIACVDGVAYELPLGYADKRVLLLRNVLDGTVYFQHKGTLIKLMEVNLLANARRGTSPKQEEEEEEIVSQPTSAEMAFNQDFRRLVDKDGNYF